MSERRTRSITTKLTDREFDLISQAAFPTTVSVWARDRLLGAVQFGKADLLHVALLAEFAALRHITINMMFQAVPVGTLHAQVIRDIMERADRDKVDSARRGLAKVAAELMTKPR